MKTKTTRQRWLPKGELPLKALTAISSKMTPARDTAWSQGLGHQLMPFIKAASTWQPGLPDGAGLRPMSLLITVALPSLSLPRVFTGECTGQGMKTESAWS